MRTKIASIVHYCLALKSPHPYRQRSFVCISMHQPAGKNLHIHRVSVICGVACAKSIHAKHSQHSRPGIFTCNIDNHDACHPLTYFYLKDVPHTSHDSSVEYQLQTQYRNVYMCEPLSRIENILWICTRVHSVEPGTALCSPLQHMDLQWVLFSVAMPNNFDI